MDGIILINKEIGYTSQDVVSKVKKILNIKKAGHTGTLDPMAEGVLPILIGNYTKLSKYLIEHDKKYIATIKLGQKRDTGDSEGKVIEEREVKALSEDEINSVLKSFIGKTLQKPPMYSAIKINGKKLYEYAREGIEIDVPSREIEIYEIKLLDFSLDEIAFEVKCSKGTYIRTLCEDISQKLNMVGYMKRLKRVEVDKFRIEDAITLEEVDCNKERLQEMPAFITMESYFSNLAKIVLDEKTKFLNGQLLDYDLVDGIYNVYEKNEYLGIGIVKNRKLKRDIVIWWNDIDK